MSEDRARLGLGNLDLNLMRALDALLREGNVTRAAERLNLSQPTLSASLSRLRKHFGDELLRRDGNQLTLTPLALRLAPLAREALDSAERLFRAHVVFDPASSTRRFTVVASDYGTGVVGAWWSAAVSLRASYMRTAFRNWPPESLFPLEVRSRDVDGLIAPHGLPPEDMPHLDVVTDRWVIVADQDNKLLSDEPTFGELIALPWVSAFDGPRQVPAGIDPREWSSISASVQVVVDSLADLPLCVRNTNRVGIVQERLMKALGTDAGLRVFELPFTVEPIRLAFWWHPAYDEDPEHVWFRSLLADFPAGDPLVQDIEGFDS
jgi:DNA-binding transcriptional LysR family regulator